MKYFKSFVLVLVIVLSSCKTINVVADYDTTADFNKYKTFAFYKTGIDKAAISSLDKKRILRAIEESLLAQGFTKSRRKVNINQNNMGFGFGWGWNPWMWNGMNNNVNVSESTEGTLFIDFIDKDKKELIWQGIGSGALKMQNVEKKEESIRLFVKEIISRFPPSQE